MSSEIYGYSGFQDLENVLEDYIKKVEKPIKILEVGAREFVKDLLKLTKPMSKIRKSGYVHLISSFAYRVKKNEVEAGWGKYYGPMIEHGTIKMSEQPHLNPVWNKNKEKYYDKMLNELK